MRRRNAMQIDSFTVLLFGFFIKALLGVLFVVFWLKERRARWFAWWGTTLFLGCGATVAFLARGSTADLLSIGIGNVLLICGFACCWQGARAFDGRRPLWSPIFGVPTLWIIAAFIPAFIENTGYRVIFSSSLITPLLAMTAFEFWRGRSETLPSRWPVIILFSSFSLFFALRIVLVDVLPFPFGALPIRAGSLGAFNLIMFFHTILLVVLIVAMSKERLELEQRNNAQTDPLTGALNRRAFMSRGSRLVSRHQREKKPLCLLFLDLDRFKSFNDQFGHSAGDDMLITFVSVVHANIRPSDFLFRIGGEEFCCLLPHTDIAQAYHAAERIRHKFEMASVSVSGLVVKATVSIGIASTEAFGYDIDLLTRRADTAVYSAKQQGRNRVVVASPPDTDPSATGNNVITLPAQARRG